MRFRIQRAGLPGNYFPGWIASNGDIGGLFPTWADALAFALNRIERDHACI